MNNEIKQLIEYRSRVRDSGVRRPQFPTDGCCADTIESPGARVLSEYAQYACISMHLKYSYAVAL